MDKENHKSPGRHALIIFLAVVAIFLVYAFAVQATEIDLEILQTPTRQEQLIGVLRFLADPDLTDPDILDWVTGQEEGPIRLSQVTVNTLDLIVETVFMAFVATTIGTVLAVPVSFTAARNLMQDISAPLASIMLGIALLPVGGGLGLLFSRWLVNGSAQLSQTAVLGIGGLGGTAVFMWLVSRLGPSALEGETPSPRTMAITLARLLALVLLVIFALATLAHLGKTAGDWLEAQLNNLAFPLWFFEVNFGFLGNFLAVISEFIVLALPALTALLAGLMALLLGSRYGQEAVLRVKGTPARIITGGCTALGTAVLVYGVGSVLNWLYRFDNPANWTTIPALVLGGALGLLSLAMAPKRPFAVGDLLYTISRSILNTLRSIEPLIMAIVFVVWVSLGPFAGVMALTLHTIAALGKLFSEQIEGISEGPIEAITSTGANQLQTVVFGVIPQIVPPYIAYTLYRWDINVRMSTIIGFVGGGGI
ncbi:MAG: ABC transporter permease subunit, partial [Anaerolineae bacterium]